MNRDQFEEKRRLLGHVQPTDGQSSENLVGETLGGGNTPAIEKIITDTRKHLELE
jgi:hypothetical protein